MKEGGIVTQPQSFAYLKQGTVTPLQTDAVNLKVNNTIDLQKLPIDLHIVSNFNMTPIYAEGNLLIDDQETQSAYCFNKMQFVSQNLTISKLSESGQCDLVGGNLLGRIVMYNSRDLPEFTMAFLNKEPQLHKVRKEENALFFDFTSASKQIS